MSGNFLCCSYCALVYINLSENRNNSPGLPSPTVFARCLNLRPQKLSPKFTTTIFVVQMLVLFPCTALSHFMKLRNLLRLNKPKICGEFRGFNLASFTKIAFQRYFAASMLGQAKETTFEMKKPTAVRAYLNQPQTAVLRNAVCKIFECRITARWSRKQRKLERKLIFCFSEFSHSGKVIQ